MDLKFTFSGATPDQHDHGGAPGGIPLPFAGAPSAPLSTSSVLEMVVTLLPSGDEIECDARSGDGVSYARAQRSVKAKLAAESETTDAALGLALKSVLARAGAELPEKLIESVTSVKLSLGGREAAVLTELGLIANPAAAILAQVDAPLQARTGITAGTPIVLAS